MDLHLDAVAAALPAYEVGEELGRGSWGVVFAGRHRSLEREVAIKQLAPEFATDEGVRARFASEGRVLAALAHPHVVPVYDFVEVDGLCLLVMERLRGGTLAERGTLSPPAAVAVALAACAGLHHAHERGMLHRDVKPDNLLFSRAGVLKVTDFGLAKVIGATAALSTAPGEVVGSPAFMSPEQVQGHELSPATDVYALATTLYLVLSGRLPFPTGGSLAKVFFQRIHRPAEPLDVPGLPPAIAAVVDMGLATDPADRQPAAEAFGVALARAAAAAWGAGWLAATGVVLASTGPIADAAAGAAPSDVALETTITAAPPRGDLERARRHYDSRTWSRAFETLAHIDETTPLPADALELLADSAYMIGRIGDHVRALERAYAAHLEAGRTLCAGRCAFWLAVNLIDEGERARAAGWFARLKRLVEDTGGAGAERGYAHVADAYSCLFAGDLEGVAAAADEAQAIAVRSDERDLFALAALTVGMMLAMSGRTREAMPMFDEAMVAVTAGETSPMASGNIYCGSILGCRIALEPRRAHEWTAAMTAWCEQQTGLVAFSGICQVHRSQLLALGGEWDAAVDEALRAGERCLKANNRTAAGESSYVAGEVHRLRGDLETARDCYREASRLGRDPQPGLALLRVAQGRTADATAAMRRVLEETHGGQRAAVLPAFVEVMLAAGEVEPAAAAADELAQIAEDQGFPMVAASSAYARGALALSGGDARAARGPLREARRLWDEIGVPYESARARVLLAAAFEALGDHDSAELERDTAREIFSDLGAAPDIGRVDAA